MLTTCLLGFLVASDLIPFLFRSFFVARCKDRRGEISTYHSQASRRQAQLVSHIRIDACMSANPLSDRRSDRCPSFPGILSCTLFLLEPSDGRRASTGCRYHPASQQASFVMMTGSPKPRKAASAQSFLRETWAVVRTDPHDIYPTPTTLRP